MQIDKDFEKVIPSQKSDRLTPPMERNSLPTAATASDIRLDRRFAFRFDARAAKWDLKRPRTLIRSRFVFFLFFVLGGESACFLRKEANSPPPKLAFGVQIELKL